ncbi:hypothetical protein HKI87_03g21160 [Chloropicon roscoffensis]|uniref:Uncharacterized protein n=1 Tax=Chloropicon roscoffensis TaxID=1461544 RepID=A0AAX4P2Q1_9CHLO
MGKSPEKQGVSRVGWLDTQKSNVIRETIEKEDKIRHKFIRAHSTLNPEDLEETESVATTTLSSVFPQPEKHWSTELSKYLWRNCNPGYILKTQQVPSTTKEHFSFDEEEENGLLGKVHNRRRDAFTKYLESSARYKLLMKKGS